MIYYTFCDELWRYHYTFCKELYDSPTHTVISPPRITFWRTSSTGGLLTPLLTNPLILHLHHHFLQTRLAGSCTAELQACTVFRK